MINFLQLLCLYAILSLLAFAPNAVKKNISKEAVMDNVQNVVDSKDFVNSDNDVPADLDQEDTDNYINENDNVNFDAEEFVFKAFNIDLDRNMSIGEVAKLCSYCKIKPNINDENKIVLNEAVKSDSERIVKKLIAKNNPKSLETEDYFDEPATREDAIFIIHQSMLVPLRNVITEPRSENFELERVFSDIEGMSDWGKWSLQSLYMNSYIHGYGGQSIGYKEPATLRYCKNIIDRFDANEYKSIEAKKKYNFIASKINAKGFFKDNYSALAVIAGFISAFGQLFGAVLTLFAVKKPIIKII